MDKSVSERLEQLERQNRRFKRVGIVVVLLVAAGALMGQSIPVNQEVRAQKFSLYDSTGRNRGMFFTSQAGQTIFVLTDRRGAPRLTLTVTPDGSPSIGVTDNNDKVRAELSISKDSPRLALYSKEEREQVLLTIGSDGFPRFGLMDKNKSPRIVAGASGEQWVIATYGPKGEITGGIGEKK